MDAKQMKQLSDEYSAESYTVHYGYCPDCIRETDEQNRQTFPSNGDRITDFQR